MGGYIFLRLEKAPAAKRPRAEVAFRAEAPRPAAGDCPTPAAHALNSRVKLYHR